MDKYLKANIAFSKFSRDYIEQKKDLPIRPSEMGVLNIIIKREGLFTPLIIAELLGVSKPMIASHITVLESKGYIYKETSPTDKRSFYIKPTKKAITLVNIAEKNINKHLNKIENKLGKDKFKILIDLLEETNQILEQDKEL